MNEAIGEDFSMLSETLLLSLPAAKRLTKSERPNPGLPHQSSDEDAVRDSSKSACASPGLLKPSASRQNEGSGEFLSACFINKGI